MTKAQLLEKATVNERKIKAFGGEITIRNLTIKEMIDVSNSEKEEEATMQMVSYAMVKPHLSVEEIAGLSGLYIDDITKIVQEVSPSATK